MENQVAHTFTNPVSLGGVNELYQINEHPGWNPGRQLVQRKSDSTSKTESSCRWLKS